MSQKPQHAHIFIAGKKIQIPVYHDLKETQRIADLVTERIKKIEADAERIDTQAFALQTAFEYAAEALALRQDMDEQQRELIKVLDGILAHLNRLNDTVQGEG